MSGAKSSDTVTATFLDEGKRTIGVWLPLALADVYAALIAFIRLQAANPEKIKIPSRSEVLTAWCLPMLSSSLSSAEEEAKALELFRSIQNLAAKNLNSSTPNYHDKPPSNNE
ncbi:MAG: hypothetical protein IJQ34_02150 [Kiritimatiellae bacterium]|nr:hypothetical protein [Kiritimatiellia bacterium]